MCKELPATIRSSMLCRDLLEVCNIGSTDAVFLKIGGSSSFFKVVNEILVKPVKRSLAQSVLSYLSSLWMPEIKS